MDESIKLIMLWIFVGAFAGAFYWSALFMFCSGFYIQYINSQKHEKPLVIFTHATFVPTLALILLGLFVAYNAFINSVSMWFILGTSLPLIIMFFTKKEV